MQMLRRTPMSVPSVLENVDRYSDSRVRTSAGAISSVISDLEKMKLAYRLPRRKTGSVGPAPIYYRLTEDGEKVAERDKRVMLSVLFIGTDRWPDLGR